MPAWKLEEPTGPFSLPPQAQVQHNSARAEPWGLVGKVGLLVTLVFWVQPAPVVGQLAPDLLSTYCEILEDIDDLTDPRCDHSAPMLSTEVYDAPAPGSLASMSAAVTALSQPAPAPAPVAQQQSVGAPSALQAQVAPIPSIAQPPVTYAQVAPSVSAPAVQQAPARVYQSTLDASQGATPGVPTPRSGPPFAITFTSGSALDSAAENRLDRLVQALLSAPVEDVCLKLVGHADTAGDAGANRRLSMKRAETVQDYMTSRLNPARFALMVEAAGEDKPLPGIEGTDTRNRRVEIMAKHGRTTCF